MDSHVMHRKLVEETISFMRLNLTSFDRNLSLDSLASRSGFSKSHFIDLFENTTGITPHHFLTSLRMKKAKELLLETSKTATEIALEVGYFSFPTFSRTFSNYVGCSPKNFRKQSSCFSKEAIIRAVSKYNLINDGLKCDYSIKGDVNPPDGIDGAIFVGIFSKGVPQGIPDFGTILIRQRQFHIGFPDAGEIRLLATLVPFDMLDMLNSGEFVPQWVASSKVSTPLPSTVHLELRKTTNIDPPIVMSLRSLLG